MCEAFGLDRKIERYKGTKPISLYRWDLECVLDVLDWVLNDERQYPDNGCPEYIALNDLRASLLYLYQQTYHVQQAPNRWCAASLDQVVDLRRSSLGNMP